MWFQINYCGAKSNEGGIMWTSPWGMRTISTVKDEGRCKKDEPWTRNSTGLTVTYKAWLFKIWETEVPKGHTHSEKEHFFLKDAQ